MQQLWAPWRAELIQQRGPPGCIFCLFPAETGAGADRRNLIVARTERSFAILNRFPYNNGHLMVVPRRHAGDFASLSTEESADLQRLLQRSTAVLNEAYRPEGMNLGMNLGKSAGAGIADHLHWHVVPRWAGDTNFMPVLADTKVMIEHLDSTFDTLQPLFRERGGG
jgi:ATP adenylyltransferase